jgi:hypothetical protein
MDGNVMAAGATTERVMKRTFALLTGVAIALGSLAMASSGNAAMRQFGQDRYYGAVPVVPQSRENPVVPGFRESPVYAPDLPSPRGYNNPGIPDFQDGSRG